MALCYFDPIVDSDRCLFSCLSGMLRRSGEPPGQDFGEYQVFRAGTTFTTKIRSNSRTRRKLTFGSVLSRGKHDEGVYNEKAEIVANLRGIPR